MRTQLIAAVAILACGFAAEAQNSPARSRAPNQPGDAEILATLIVLDSAVMLDADVALRKRISGAVREYATALRHDHQANIGATSAVAARANVSPAANPAIDSLRQITAHARSELMAFDGHEFERMYLNALVEGHAIAFIAIEKKLMPAAMNPGVKVHLIDVRARIANHLVKARELQSRTGG